MAVEIRVPSAGESITEGVVSRWLKKDGEIVRAGEPVVELETEKATTEVPAPASGKLIASVPEGKTVTIGQVLGRIEEQEIMATTPASQRTMKPGVSGDGVRTKQPPGDAVP